MRLYLTDREKEYVEFDPSDVESAVSREQPGLAFPIHNVVVADESVLRGKLDDAHFDALFASDATLMTSGWQSQMAALVEHEERAGRRPSLDGSHFRCCYTNVFCVLP